MSFRKFICLLLSYCLSLSIILNVYGMGEYGRKQENQLSRAIANCGKKSGGLSRIVDNRIKSNIISIGNTKQLFLDPNCPITDDGFKVHADAYLNRVHLGHFTNTPGAHAEENILQAVNANQQATPPPIPLNTGIKNELYIFLSSSPCNISNNPQTGTGCAEKLIALEQQGVYHVIVRAKKYYQPHVKGAKDSSIAAATSMQSAGIQF